MRLTFLVMSFFCLAMIAGGCQPPADNGTLLAKSDDPRLIFQANEMKPVAAGVNTELTFKAPSYGELFLYDFTSGDFIFRGDLTKGEQFVFEPASSLATVNKQWIALIRDTNDKDEYRLFFVAKE